jgi:hypothetical protein
MNVGWREVAHFSLAPALAGSRRAKLGDLGKMLKKHIPGMCQLFGGCEAIRYNFSVCVEGNLSRGVVTSVVSEPELKIDALP